MNPRTQRLSLITLLLLLLPILQLPLFGQSAEHDFAIRTMTDISGSLSMEQIIESSGIPDRNRAEGMFLIGRYIREGKKKDVFRALELLEQLPADTPLRLVYLGMAHAFKARIRTIFGVGNLEAMQEAMRGIDEHYPDPLVRFLRGNTLVQVGRALPSIFSIRDIKKEAVRVGTADLEYVLSAAETPGSSLPEPFQTEARRVLAEEE